MFVVVCAGRWLWAVTVASYMLDAPGGIRAKGAMSRTATKGAKMKKAFGFVAGLFVLGLLALPAHAEKWNEVNAQDVKSMMDKGGVTVINPLSKIEFNDLAIKGSINAPLDELEQKLPKDKGAKLVFYCLGPK